MRSPFFRIDWIGSSSMASSTQPPGTPPRITQSAISTSSRLQAEAFTRGALQLSALIDHRRRGFVLAHAAIGPTPQQVIYTVLTLGLEFRRLLQDAEVRDRRARVDAPLRKCRELLHRRSRQHLAWIVRRR